MPKPLFTPEELEELRRADAEIDEEFDELGSFDIDEDHMELDKYLDWVARWEDKDYRGQAAMEGDRARKRRNRDAYNARRRADRAANPEKYRELDRARRAADPDHARQLEADFRSRHRAELAEKARARYHADPESARERNRNWVQAHPEEAKAAYRKYQEANREKIRARDKAYRQRKLAEDPDYYKKRYAANPEAAREKSRRYRERQRLKKQAELRTGEPVIVSVVLMDALGALLAPVSVSVLAPDPA